MTTEDKPQMPLFSPEDEKEAQKELKRLRKNENVVHKVNHKRTGFEDKSIWDWLQLLATLAVPLILGIATIGFGLLQIHLADMQHQQDQQSARDQQQAAILQTYIDNIQDLLLNRNLLKSNQTDDVAILSRARTLTALQGLDPERKGRLVQFLYEANLIGYENSKNKPQHPVINLDGAGLTGATFKFADLIGADLSCNLFSFNNFERSDCISLDNVDFSDAILSSANLGGAYHLSQQQLDRVYTCEGAKLPKGLTCHHNV